MSNWSFDVRHGPLDKPPTGLADTIAEQRQQKSASFVVAEAGNFLNEPDDRIVQSISDKTSAHDAIASLAQACSWLFDMLEVEVDQYFQNNYLRLTFVNLKSVSVDKESRSGVMTTNSAELPSPSEQPPAWMIHQFVTTLRIFFSQLRGCVELSSTDAELHTCNWVTVTFNRAV